MLGTNEFKIETICFGDITDIFLKTLRNTDRV